MALDYNGSANLMNDLTFRGRVKVAVLHYAGFIIGEPATTPAHSSRLKWANSALLQPDFVTQQVQPIVVGDDNIQAATQPDASDIADTVVQTATETAINKIL
jgi:hypothetical protein